MSAEHGVRMRRRGWLVAGALALLGCGQPDDPQAALDATVQRLQDALEAKDTDAVLDLLDAKFRAQDELDREWARKTMALEVVELTDEWAVRDLKICVRAMDGLRPYARELVASLRGW